SGEFLFDLTFDTRTQGGNHDTMTDMMAGLFPAFLIAAALYAHRRYGTFRYLDSLKLAGQSKISCLLLRTRMCDSTFRRTENSGKLAACIRLNLSSFKPLPTRQKKWTSLHVRS